MASNTTTSALADKHSHPIKPGTPAVAADKIAEYTGALPGWVVKDGAISKTFNFKNYHETIAFVNAIAWIAHHEDHHPDLEVGYNRCKITYSTHSVGGLSENDFICAAKVEKLMR
jgi:4a-hydroxytetrahydrobiopterin dehydratase